MYYAEYSGANSFLIGASQLLLKNGIKRTTRGENCIELPTPFMFKINNPKSRLITIPERKWNPVLPYAESLWLASGRNDLKMIGHYLNNMKNFSDDGQYLRGGYGPRLRSYSGISNDYKVSNSNYSINNQYITVDQFKYIYDVFQKDINTRRAVISLGDPPKDDMNIGGNIKETKDYPCTRSLQFQKDSNSNRLNLTVYMRSNDLIWGASAVNVFNYTYMQEYFAQILNLDVGDYYHFVNNFHYYEKFQKQVESIAKIKQHEDYNFDYSKNFNSLEQFDEKIKKLSKEEALLREGIDNGIILFGDDFFDDWFKTFYIFNTKKNVKFSNFTLNHIFKKYTSNE